MNLLLGKGNRHRMTHPVTTLLPSFFLPFLNTTTRISLYSMVISLLLPQHHGGPSFVVVLSEVSRQLTHCGNFRFVLNQCNQDWPCDTITRPPAGSPSLSQNGKGGEVVIIALFLLPCPF